MYTVTHNMLAMNAGRELKINTNNKTKASEKLSSGYRINRAADDAAGLAISEKMRWLIRGLNQGSRNTQDGISWIQTGDGAMEEVSDILHRITELAVEAANDTLQDEDRRDIDMEVSQLKKEINRIGKTTTFNAKQIFDNSNTMLGVSGMPSDMEIFNATYNSATGEATFGGIVFHGERIPWNTINSSMVTIDANGNQIFVGGDYSYQTASGYQLNFHCEDGAAVPDITRSFSVSASGSGITIDGETFPWSALTDEDGNSFSASNMHDGAWVMDYHGAQVNFFVSSEVNSLTDMIDEINSLNTGSVTYSWTASFSGLSTETAVDVNNLVQSLQISQTLANHLATGSNYSLTVRCDSSGIWLADAGGNLVADSRRTWADMGIHSWNTGSDISSGTTYTYYAGTSPSNALMSFNFQLSDITSVDSVIDGLDGMTISNQGIQTSYQTTSSYSSSGSSNVQSFSSRASIGVSFGEEYALGRNFDVSTGLNLTSATTVSGDTASVNYGNTIVLTGSISDMTSSMASDLSTYWSFAESRMVNAVLAGRTGASVLASVYASTDLADIVGSGNITTTGYLSENMTLTSSMNRTSGTLGYTSGTVGTTYPAAVIDFQNISSASMLLGSGFDSTCRTCNNHYSVSFVDLLENPSTTASGYKYSLSAQGNNYQLSVDISSMSGLGGADLADALLEVVDECYDFHYTQYATDGSKFYIYDDRTADESSSRTNATFDTKPYSSISEGSYSLTLSNSDGDYIETTYQYDFSSSASKINVAMTVSDTGQYVLSKNGSYVSYKSISGDSSLWSQYQTDNDGNLVRYNVNVSYTDAEGNETDRETALVSNAKNYIVEDMLTETTTTLAATDYTYMQIGGDENSNVAIRANFENEIVSSQGDGIWIQHSSIVKDGIYIPRFPLNSVVLGITGLKTRPRDNAERAISQAQEALKYVSDKRALFGAYQNRLEHTYASNQIKEENMAASESLIRDVDMAMQMVEYSKHNILEQASMSVLSQANSNMQGVLSLFQ